MFILGIETSCDETALSVLKDNVILSDIVSSQYFHELYGGVVPELASRAHLKIIPSLYNEALKKAKIQKSDIDAIAVTEGPGLIGSILVGLNFAKALSYSLNIPLIAVNHIEAHLLSVYLEEEKPNLPYIGLVVSGGHTLLVLVQDIFKYKVLGCTKDDSAGEAYDKVAKMLGLSYPGGPIIDKLAKNGDPKFHKFPVPCKNSNDFSFSFSGLKTSMLYYLKKLKKEKPEINFTSEPFINNVCASFQESVISVLSDKLIEASKKYNVSNIAVTGGVSANSALRNRLSQEAKKNCLNLYIPNIKYSTDNASMIAMVGKFKYENNFFSKLNITASPNLKLNEI
jgi:N6-L-threonylcarbamoyladenine synthase